MPARPRSVPRFSELTKEEQRLYHRLNHLLRSDDVILTALRIIGVIREAERGHDKQEKA